MITPLARRRLLQLAVGAPLLGWAGAAAADAACVDVSALTDAEKGLRTSLNFQLVSDDPKRVCSGCTFFVAGQGDCGACGLLNGPTTVKSRCDSWAPK